MEVQASYFMKWRKSFGHAWHGIRYCFATQINFRIHLMAVLIVMALGVVVKLSTTEWLFIIGCSMLVITLEVINTAIEYLCDTITKDIHPVIKTVKDLSAAAVLIAVAGSVLSGAIIFLPKMLDLLR